MLADGLVWARPEAGLTDHRRAGGHGVWLPGQVRVPVPVRIARKTLTLRFRLVVQRYRHNTLCRHELGRRVAGFACVRLFTTGQVEWVPNKPHALLPFEENLEQFGTPTLVRAAQQSAHAWTGC